jgi:hypothetical protein
MNIDEVAIQRAMSGDKTIVLRPHEYVIAVHKLRDQGVGINESAARLGLSDRHVSRLRGQDVPMPMPTPPVVLPSPVVLEGLPAAALDLVWKVRDRDPVEVWQKLSNLDRDRLQALTVALAALVPDDRTEAQLFEWSDSLVDEVVAS